MRYLLEAASFKSRIDRPGTVLMVPETDITGPESGLHINDSGTAQLVECDPEEWNPEPVLTIHGDNLRQLLDAVPADWCRVADVKASLEKSVPDLEPFLFDLLPLLDLYWESDEACYLTNGVESISQLKPESVLVAIRKTRAFTIGDNAKGMKLVTFLTGHPSLVKSNLDRTFRSVLQRCSRVEPIELPDSGKPRRDSRFEVEGELLTASVAEKHFLHEGEPLFTRSTLSRWVGKLPSGLRKVVGADHLDSLKEGKSVGYCRNQLSLIADHKRKKMG